VNPSTLFLGLIAAAAVVMAVVQVGVIVVLVRLARRVEEVSHRVEREIAPLAERLTRVADNLQQATSLASVQVERVDRLLSSATRRAEETMGLIQGAVVGPMREGLAVIAAIRGVVGAFKSFRDGDGGRGSSRFDDEDPLFIG
jgi:two-component sensor histidine kinase